MMRPTLAGVLVGLLLVVAVVGLLELLAWLGGPWLLTPILPAVYVFLRALGAHGGG